ncbi:hypothetical protein B0H63DRAFT_556151 [Podospora didyma]|uniref:Uncharacterized protein n=1 Tax=Podospora didyma TaxID=330526 RepID=A0AAE0P844_9PEZI|nr:hypothetical protein B0H63DRAFT_556151 [Podospora didyma]
MHLNINLSAGLVTVLLATSAVGSVLPYGVRGSRHYHTVDVRNDEQQARDLEEASLYDRDVQERVPFRGTDFRRKRPLRRQRRRDTL